MDNLGLTSQYGIPFWVIILSSLVISLLITFSAIPILVKIAVTRNLFSLSNGREPDAIKVPILGGVAIFIAFVTPVLLLSWNSGIGNLGFLIVSASIVFFTGLIDDIHNLGPWKKLMAQILAASIVIFACDLRIDNFYGFFGFSEIPYFLSVIITLFFIVGIINGFNLIDGIDGLASAIGILASLITGIFFISADNSNSAIISFSLAGALITFFCFNVFGTENKIYMGDTGSMLTGHIISFQILQFLGTDSSKYHFSIPVIAFSVLIVPIFDTLRVIVIRLVNRKSPFKADKNHMHHLLLNFGLSHFGVTVILSTATVCFVIAGIIFHSLREFAILSILVVSTIVTMWLGKATRGLHRKIEIKKDS